MGEHCTVTLVIDFDNLTCQLIPGHPGMHYCIGHGGGVHWIEQVTR
jgi:hypothetical protein